MTSTKRKGIGKINPTYYTYLLESPSKKKIIHHHTRPATILLAAPLVNDISLATRYIHSETGQVSVSYPPLHIVLADISK